MTTTIPVRRAAPGRGRAEALVADHVRAIETPLASLRNASGQVARWGATLAQRLGAGGRLLVAGNGGSAAEAQHLTAELVGRFHGDRPAYSAIALTADTSSLTAIGNDYGFEDVFARQVEAHGRRGDVLLLLSTSGRSPNLLAAARTARRLHVTSWAITGPAGNPLARAVDDALTLEGASPSVQEVELVAIHALCRAFDDAVGLRGEPCES